MPLKAWSYSRLVDFQTCKLRAKLKYLDKIPEPERELKPGQTEQANDRGTRIHEAAELYVKGGVELIPELACFSQEFIRLRELYAEGKVSLEGDWAVNRDWAPVGFFSDDAWGRLKIDAMVMLDPTHSVVIDYKTGRRSGNELKHNEQTQLYAIGVVMRDPKVEKITTELWYPDQDDLHRVVYSRDQALRYFTKWNGRGLELTSATEFPPNPNKFSCRYCRFGPKDGGPCPVGV